MPPFRIVADHPKEKGVVHVGDVYSTLEDAQEALKVSKVAGPSPGGPSLDERVVADPVADAKALGAELYVTELVPDEMGTDDAGQEVAVTSKWKKVG